jgi:uncharacterized protein (UPF0332 family)
VIEDARLHIREAEDCLAQAELMLASSFPGASVSRSYYAMFHAATAALLQRGVKRRSHQGIIAAFGQTFVKPGIVDARFHKYLTKAFSLRQESDYLPMVRLVDERAREVIDWAKEFVVVCRKLCE